MVFISYTSFTCHLHSSEDRISVYIGYQYLQISVYWNIIGYQNICKCVFVTILDFKDNFSKLRWSLLVTSFTYHLQFWRQNIVISIGKYRHWNIGYQNNCKFRASLLFLVQLDSPRILINPAAVSETCTASNKS